MSSSLSVKSVSEDFADAWKELKVPRVWFPYVILVVLIDLVTLSRTLLASYSRQNMVPIYKSLQTISIILALAGTFMLAFGLKVRRGIINNLRKKLEIEKKGLNPPTDVKQRTGLLFLGLVLISIAALLQLWTILWF